MAGVAAALTAFVVGCAASRGEAPPTPEELEEGGMHMLVDRKGEGPPLLLVGGGLTGWASWEPHQQRLASLREVARAQLLNVQLGLEGRPLPPGYSVAMESAALAAAVDSLGWSEPIDIVAWSYGAVVTLDYALGHQERVKSLALIEPPAFWVLQATGTVDEGARREWDELRALHEQMDGEVSVEQLAAFARQAGFVPPDKAPQEMPSWPSWVRHRRSLLNGPAVFAHHDNDARLRAFQRPVLLVKGSGSTHLLHRVVHVLAQTMPDARTIELPGGHAPQLAAMDDFLLELAAFQRAASR